MNFDWLESVIFGFVSGLTEFLPVSVQAHETLMRKLFGSSEGALLALVVHGATLLALCLNMRQQVAQLLRERNLSRIPPRRRKRQPDLMKILELRLLKTALIPMLLAFVGYFLLGTVTADLSITALLLVVNGLILYIPGHMPNGNKDARSMSSLDGVLLGLSGAVAILPGISRIGAVSSAAIARGADKENALRWGLLLCIPALLVFFGIDVLSLVSGGMPALSFPVILQCILSAAAAFGGASLGIGIMRFLAVRTGFSGFAYYCWGTALFSFLMYLTI